MLPRILLTLCLMFSSVAAWAAYPYDSVAEIAVKKGTRFNGGSATLIAVTEDKALLLTCRHVVLSKNKEVFIKYRNGDVGRGIVHSVAPNGLDAALVIATRPEGIEPVPVVALSPAEGRRIVNAGYPGNDHVLRWQVGTTTSQSSTTLRYNVRPIPGMSGGATFDEYGNLVAVVQFYNRSGGGSTGGTALLSYIRKFIAEQKVSGWYGETPQHDEKASSPVGGSLAEAPDEFSAWVAWIYKEFDTGPVKEFLQMLKDVEPQTDIKVAKPPVVIDTPRVHIRSHSDLEIVITRHPRRTRNHCRRLRILRRR